MKHLFGVLALLCLTASTARAEGLLPRFCCGPYRVETGVNAYFRVIPLNTGTQLGPWYLYYPLEAHFMHQAPGFHGTTMHQTLPPGFQGYPPRQGAVSAGYWPQAPAYWYKP